MQTIERVSTDEEIAGTFEVMVQLRPHLARAEYVECFHFRAKLS